MKPISLTVAGLQSFREPQTIPFSELCSGGVFGIFGPTGSGKSTILDAITLALYGKVERANGGTNGIMNNSEDKLSVSFTFALNSGAEVKEYKVERSYKRTGEHTVRTASCRLSEVVNGETMVHADKERDVTQHVQQILGLTIEDFTRAVVLPQGKFAEFLSLKGAERRQMLQRLFQLEKYGDKLNTRLKRRADEEKAKWNELLAEQSGLGDASADALLAAEKELKQCEMLYAESKKNSNEAEKQAELAKRVKDAQEELSRLQEEKDKLEDRRNEVSELKQRLDAAIQADKLLPYYEECRRTEAETKEMNERLQHLQTERNKLLSEWKEVSALNESLKAETEEKVPLLNEHLSLMKEAVKKQDILRDTDMKQASSFEMLQAYKRKMDVLTHEVQKASDTLSKGELKKKELLQVQNSNTVSSEERRMLADAAARKGEYTQTLQNAESIRAEIVKMKIELAESEDQQLHVSQKKKELNQDAEKLMQQMQAVYGRLCESVRVKEKLLRVFHSLRKNYRDQSEKRRLHELAIELAASLKDGEPCTVCGSVNHPSPFESEGTAKKIEAFNEDYFEESLRKLGTQSERAAERMEELAAKIIDHSSSQLELAASADTYSEEAAALEMDNIGFEDAMHAAETELKMLLQDVIQLEEAAKAFVSKKERIEKSADAAVLKQKMIQQLIDPMQEKLVKAEARSEELMRMWSEHFLFDLSEVDHLHNQLHEKDTLREDAEKRLGIAETFLAEKTALLAEKKEELSELDKKAAIETSRFEILKQTVNELQTEISRITGGGDSAALLQETQSKLDHLLSSSKEMEQRCRKVHDSYNRCDREHHASSEALKRAEEREAEASKMFNEKLTSSNFAAADSVEKAIASPEQQQKWNEHITAFEDEGKDLSSRIAAIKSTLPEKALSMEEWDQIINKLNDAKEMLEISGQRLGEARSTYVQLEKNHLRYTELEKMKAECEVKCLNFSKLQAVFRGNTFVEFAAEEQLHQITIDASERLARLTRGRYAIEVDSSNGFVMRDDANGGIKRPVSSLSGGETFLTSLALALSLSAQIQLRGRHPLQFFFLDEGFGTLDQELLDTVVTALEKLQMNSFAIGVISHVPELKARLSKKVLVTPSDFAGKGSTVALAAD
ncbi:AAA family ATPase [Fictibacillus aquaticus]|uniref:Nuclease SbcCD subunit C n=1 Tax=Fictibacillus aquaticus TaxID=2021314 RepID=A0A235FDX0_9BACL|nr:AAA family ATPase [Fictibacillus aquaticus]OYD59127.1 hypothetical protein CGZ90_04310 [Fictibacillus aquaticus]